MPLSSAAALIPVRPGGEILLMLRDDRPGLPNANRWSTIGGAVEAGESPDAAALREAEEELGRAPSSLLPLGTVDGARFRSFLFATRVAWSLDELILGEGQGIDWLSRDEVFAVPLARGIGPALLDFLGSPLYLELASGRPDRPRTMQPPLPPSIVSDLGLHPGQLLEVRGATAAFVRRLWDVLDGARVTASPGAGERPNALLWWPRAVHAPDLLERACRTLAPGGSVWVMVDKGTAEMDAESSVRARARSLGLRQTEMLILPTGERAVRFALPNCD